MKLATYLSKHGLTEEAFAAEVKQSVFAVRKWANGQRFPRESNLREIARATKGKVTAADFLEARAAA